MKCIKVKCIYWNVSVGLKCVQTSSTEFLQNLLPLKIVVSRKFISFSDISAVNLMVGWCLFTSRIN